MNKGKKKGNDGTTLQCTEILNVLSPLVYTDAPYIPIPVFGRNNINMID